MSKPYNPEESYSVSSIQSSSDVLLGLPPPDKQPTWMATPEPVPGCPPGLEYLAYVDQIIIRQDYSIMEMFTHWEIQNKFRLYNNRGQQIYFVMEESHPCMRQLCGRWRGFAYHFTDNVNQEVFCLRRNFDCLARMLWCPGQLCRYFASCEDKNGQNLGYISNLPYLCTPHFAIYDTRQQMIAEVKGACCHCQNTWCSRDVNFEIYDTITKTHIGTIKKTWQGALKHVFTDADCFTILFPMNYEVWKKVLVIGTVFIIDIMLYERRY